MLDEYWSANPDVQSVPIYQASGLAMKALSVYQTYIEMMNDDIKKAFQVNNMLKNPPVVAFRHSLPNDSCATWTLRLPISLMISST